MQREKLFARFLISVAVTALLCQGLPAALAAEPEAADALDRSDISYCPSADETRVGVSWLNGECWLFLPASARLDRLAIEFPDGPLTLSVGEESLTVESGAEFDLTRLFPAEPEHGIYSVMLGREEEQLLLNIMRSANIPSLYLSSADPERDRNWVEDEKGNSAKGSALFLAADGSVIFSGELKQIKGRGNSTWDYPKKPYQIKLAKAADLMETGLESEAAKTWVLLANYCDPSQLHNRLTYQLADALGLAYTPHCRPVDLYYDGEYRGCYLLCEKTEVGKGRVEVDDLGKRIEELNSAVADMDALPVAEGLTPAGQPCQYVGGLAMPEELRGGYLLEIDFSGRAREEKSWFCSSLGKYLVCKSPEYLPKEGMDYISALWQEFEDAIVAGGVNPTTGRRYDEIMDLPSLAKCYLLEELSWDCDAFQSSAFFYKPAGEEKLYAGPVWDFDSAYDVQADGSRGVLTAASTLLGKYLIAIPGFRAEVRRCYAELLRRPLEDAIAARLDTLAGEMLSSQAMDAVLWPEAHPVDSAQAVESFRSFLRLRHAWLYEEVMSWWGGKLPVTGFCDVYPDAWYADAVRYVAEQGLFYGVSEFQFEPEGSMTRAMIVTLLYRMAGSPAVEGTDKFPDVAAGQWYSTAIAWAAENGIALGEGNGNFRPNRDITLQELLAFVRRYVQLQTPPDTEKVPEEMAEDGNAAETAEENWAQADIAWAEESGIMAALQDGPLPADTALRCHAAVIFQRLAAMMEQK